MTGKLSVMSADPASEEEAAETIRLWAEKTRARWMKQPPPELRPMHHRRLFYIGLR